MKVLIIEDEPGIANAIQRGLAGAGYDADLAADGRSGLALATEHVYGAIVLDIMLPGMDGWRVCEELRESGNQTPILMLTAKDEVEDRVRGLDIGADDYLSKPFDFRELLARVRSLLRRDKIHKARKFRVADLEIDTAQRRVTRAGAEIGLSRREYDLIEALASHSGQVLTRDMIQQRIWMDEDSYSNTVDVYIGMLRKKVDAGHPVKLIHTIRGAGYSLRVPEE
jgi:two-component system copper resistance phosphate regulon response regulator CusR